MLQLVSGKVNDMDYETLHPGIAAGFALWQKETSREQSKNSKEVR